MSVYQRSGLILISEYERSSAVSGSRLKPNSLTRLVVRCAVGSYLGAIQSLAMVQGIHGDTDRAQPLHVPYEEQSFLRAALAFMSVHQRSGLVLISEYECSSAVEKNSPACSSPSYPPPFLPRQSPGEKGGQAVSGSRLQPNRLTRFSWVRH
jgi:hypothetical protein